MKKFDELFNHIINEFNEYMTADEEASTIAIIVDAINDEILENDIKLINNWQEFTPKIRNYVIEEINGKYNGEKTIYTIDYGELVDLILYALEDYNLIIK